jgi:hypothetical protein
VTTQKILEQAGAILKIPDQVRGWIVGKPEVTDADLSASSVIGRSQHATLRWIAPGSGHKAVISALPRWSEQERFSGGDFR